MKQSFARKCQAIVNFRGHERAPTGKGHLKGAGEGGAYEAVLTW